MMVRIWQKLTCKQIDVVTNNIRSITPNSDPTEFDTVVKNFFVQLMFSLSVSVVIIASWEEAVSGIVDITFFLKKLKPFVPFGVDWCTGCPKKFVLRSPNGLTPNPPNGFEAGGDDAVAAVLMLFTRPAPGRRAKKSSKRSSSIVLASYFFIDVMQWNLVIRSTNCPSILIASVPETGWYFTMADPEAVCGALNWNTDVFVCSCPNPKPVHTNYEHLFPLYMYVDVEHEFTKSSLRLSRWNNANGWCSDRAECWHCCWWRTKHMVWWAKRGCRCTEWVRWIEHYQYLFRNFWN